MTATATIPTIVEPSQEAPVAPTTCEHAWTLESRHSTSEGVVRYESCVRCRAHRVDLQSFGHLMPQPVSRVVGRR